mmetsp:Transcript_18719/g.38309  ORF Transcript_18719/g.38309 Transcript_18719/m.38309 type:complete len:283 (+) Transcript_18719:7466-8314(+)
MSDVLLQLLVKLRVKLRQIGLHPLLRALRCVVVRTGLLLPLPAEHLASAGKHANLNVVADGIGSIEDVVMGLGSEQIRRTLPTPLGRVSGELHAHSRAVIPQPPLLSEVPGLREAGVALIQLNASASAVQDSSPSGLCGPETPLGEAEGGLVHRSDGMVLVQLLFISLLGPAVFSVHSPTPRQHSAELRALADGRVVVVHPPDVHAVPSPPSARLVENLLRGVLLEPNPAPIQPAGQNPDGAAVDGAAGVVREGVYDEAGVVFVDVTRERALAGLSASVASD